MTIETAKNSDKTEGQTALRRNDLIVAGVMWLISLATLFESVRMTFDLSLPGVTTKPWMVAPGLLPLFFSSMLLVMLTSLIWTSLREGEFKGHFSKSQLLTKFADRARIAKFAQILLLCIYVFVGLGNVHFSIATGLYLIGAMLIAKAAKFYQIVIISVLFTTSTTYLFGSLMKIPLP